MYDTARRVALVKKRRHEYARRKQQREICGLSAACMLLFAALMQMASTVVGPGQSAARGVFGAMLLREDAGGYVLVGVVCFATARRSPRCASGSEAGKTRKKTGQVSQTRRNRREKRHEKTNT